MANEQNGKPIEWTLDMAKGAIEGFKRSIERLVVVNVRAEARIRELEKARREDGELSNALFHARNAALEILRMMAETGDLIRAITGMEARQVAMGGAIRETIEKLRDNEIPEWLIDAMMRREEEEDANRD